jgi:transcriptional regulator with XRE-family HTH domain
MNGPAFSSTFKKLRESRGWTQEEVAARLEVSRPSIAGYESKDRTPRKEMLSKIADLFDVSIDHLLGRADNGYSIDQMGKEVMISEDTTRSRRERLKRFVDSLDDEQLKEYKELMITEELEQYERMKPLLEKIAKEYRK